MFVEGEVQIESCTHVMGAFQELSHGSFSWVGCPPKFSVALRRWWRLLQRLKPCFTCEDAKAVPVLIGLENIVEHSLNPIPFTGHSPGQGYLPSKYIARRIEVSPPTAQVKGELDPSVVVGPMALAIAVWSDLSAASLT